MSEEEKEAIKFIQGEIKDLLNDIEYYKDYQNIIEKEEVHLKQTLLNLINKQQKVIDLMATELSRRPLMIYLDNERDDRLVILDNPKEIIKYYTKKVGEEND